MHHSYFQNKGFVLLMEAENRASQIISEARRRKSILLKSVSEEAEKEVEKYKIKLDIELEAVRQSNIDKTNILAIEMDKQCKAKIEELEESIKLKKDRLLEELIALVCDVKPQVCKNLRQN